MSSSEENFDIDDVSGDESEGYSPVAKKTVSTSPSRSSCNVIQRLRALVQDLTQGSRQSQGKGTSEAKVKAGTQEGLG
jgi:hypothetical protein